ncbi:unnamed protein product [Arctia plantaginis]|uniref:Uncharacterized protein n=1 Tax=Arctia plantaginis TaxID=874455 RepID=A0A8S0ZUH8_ARCPL|nr:unnamed protein product [Arctia plantaginis]
MIQISFLCIGPPESCTAYHLPFVSRVMSQYSFPTSFPRMPLCEGRVTPTKEELKWHREQLTVRFRDVMLVS